MRRGGQYIGTKNRKNETVKISNCCNTDVTDENFCPNCNMPIWGKDYHRFLPKYKEIQKGIYREIKYKLITRHVLIEKNNND